VCHVSPVLLVYFLGQLNHADKSRPNLSIVWHLYESRAWSCVSVMSYLALACILTEWRNCRRWVTFVYICSSDRFYYIYKITFIALIFGSNCLNISWTQPITNHVGSFAIDYRTALFDSLGNNTSFELGLGQWHTIQVLGPSSDDQTLVPVTWFVCNAFCYQIFLVPETGAQ